LTHQGRGTSFTIFIKAPGKNVKQEVTPIHFKVEGVDDPSVFAEYTSNFNGPKH